MPPHVQQGVGGTRQESRKQKKKTKIKQQHETFITNQVSADDVARVLHGTRGAG